MQCKCGMTTRNTVHEITTMRSKLEWGVDVDGAVEVEQDKCESCGRMMVKIWHDGNKILERG